MTRLATISASLNGMLKAAQSDLDSWKAKLADNPAYAFDRSLDAFLAAARIKIIENVLNTMQRGASLDCIHGMVRAEVVQNAITQKGQFTASPVSNYMAVCEAQVWAEVLLIVERAASIPKRAE